MKNVILVIVGLFVFSNCVNAENISTNKTTKTIIETNQNDFSNEFDNEFETIQQKNTFDPLNGYNRMMTSFNDFVFLNVMNPVAKGYSYILPQTARVGISNFFDNLMFPIRFVNNILQLKFSNASEELGRFLVNSTFGLGGFMDPASTEFGWKKHEEDFGQTLGHYGIGSGFHVVLPILGPSNLRDMFSIIPDAYIDPISTTGLNDIKYKIPNTSLEGTALSTFKSINSVSLKLGQYENIKKDALDLYPFFRDIYEQKRNRDIKE